MLHPFTFTNPDSLADVIKELAPHVPPHVASTLQRALEKLQGHVEADRLTLFARGYADGLADGRKAGAQEAIDGANRRAYDAARAAVTCYLETIAERDEDEAIAQALEQFEDTIKH